MPTCSRCGKSGLFLRIDQKTRFCAECASEVERERNTLEDEAISLLLTIKEYAEKVNYTISMSSFFYYYDGIIALLKRASEIEREVSPFNHINGNFQRDYDNNVNREQLAIRDAMYRVCRYIHDAAKEALFDKPELIEMINEFREELEVYKDRFDKERSVMARTLPYQLAKACNVSLSENDSITDIDSLDGHQFEYWCADILRKNGFSDVEVTRGSGDQGVDIVAKKDEIRYAIQCKCYSSNLGNTPVQEVSAGKILYGCHVGVVMTNRYFTASAYELAKATGTLLWDRDKLFEMTKQS